MQEHIRRAHPEHYISKLPATEESFQLMINTPPTERPPQPPPPPQQPFGNSGTAPSCSFSEIVLRLNKLHHMQEMRIQVYTVLWRRPGAWKTNILLPLPRPL